MFGAGDVRVVDIPEPTILEPTDAIIQVTLACVCGSDLHPYHSMPADETGRPMGHEFIGVVDQIGAAVTGLAPGDLVVSPFAWADNTCPICRDGFHTACPHGGFYGNWQTGGAQAEKIRVPQASGTLVKLPTDVDDALLPALLTLADVYLTGYHAAHMARVGPGKTVTVIGDGAVGLSAVLAAKQMGAERIILMGRHTVRTDLGREWGATDVVAERGEEGIAKVIELTGGEGSHVVLEAVGLMPAYEQAYGVLRPGGVISRVGVPQYEDAPVGFGSLFGKNATLNGGPAPVRAYLEDALAQVLDGRLDPGRVFDAETSLDDIAEAYRLMDSREALKVLVRP
ncbi:zinc-binding dehydrogenase [Occultella aeris]|uniref:NADP-dependent isopropanol dehydrogenase n=2 Tax=Occultella aeris TaxID=2761496 RepID=A0A7M4DEW8_9MICO|nr:NADP-dependent isopropanol dehydrogenase [Occultella aeris]